MGYTSKLRNWLVLFRAHTAVLEAPLPVISAALAFGTIFKPIIVFWAIFGILYHFVGYGMNSYVDWHKGFDKDDPRKQHHPLNTGDIKPEDAKVVIFVLLGTLMAFGVIISRFHPIAFAAMIIMLISGLTYNYFGKYLSLKFIPIAVVHTMVFAFPYLIYTHEYNPLVDYIDLGFTLMVIAYFFHHSFQIIVSGDIKDIDQDEASLLKDMGVELEHDNLASGNGKSLKVSYIALIVSHMLTVIEIGLAGTASIVLSDFTTVYVVGMLLSLALVHITGKVIRSGPFNRENRLTYISWREIIGYTMIHYASIAIIGLEVYIVISFMLLYLFVMSKFMWGNFIKPEV